MFNFIYSFFFYFSYVFLLFLKIDEKNIYLVI